jgi:hypothetical protein
MVVTLDVKAKRSLPLAESAPNACHSHLQSTRRMPGVKSKNRAASAPFQKPGHVRAPKANVTHSVSPENCAVECRFRPSASLGDSLQASRSVPAFFRSIRASDQTEDPQALCEFWLYRPKSFSSTHSFVLPLHWSQIRFHFSSRLWRRRISPSLFGSYFPISMNLSTRAASFCRPN